MAKCTQVNNPQTDNTPLECEDFISEACIIIDEAVPFLGTEDNETLKNFLIRLVDKIKSQQYAILNLENALNNHINP